MLLRPEFTKTLADDLSQGKSINLISAHGLGRRRTLLDLHMVLPGGLEVLQMDVKRFIGEKAAWIKQTLKQVAEAEHKQLIIMHNFDLLEDEQLVESFNQVADLPLCALLCVSESNAHPLLQAEVRMLPALTKEQCEVEIKRRRLPIAAEDMQAFVSFLMEHPTPYTLLKNFNDVWYAKGLWKA